MSHRQSVHLLVTSLVAFLANASLHAAQGPQFTRVQVKTEPAVVRTCPKPSCPTLIRVNKGTRMEVADTENSWLWVTWQPDGGFSRKTGWIERSAVEPVQTVATSPRIASAPSSPEVAISPADDVTRLTVLTSATQPLCLPCVANTAPPREGIPTYKLVGTGENPAAAYLPAPQFVPAPGQPGSDAIITTLETMEQKAATTFGPTLDQTARVADTVDADMIRYLDGCYQKYTHQTFYGESSGSGFVDSTGAAIGRSWFAVWAQSSTIAWNDSWVGSGVVSNATTAPCRLLWSDIDTNLTLVRNTLDRIERDARRMGIYPGVMRALLNKYRLNPGF